MPVDSFDGASTSVTPVRSGKAPNMGASVPAVGGSAHGLPNGVAQADGTANLRANPGVREAGLGNTRALTSSLKPTRAAVQTYPDRVR